MLVEVKLPSLPKGHNTATVNFWVIEEGEDVVEDDDLVELQVGDKPLTIPAPVKGTVKEIMVEDNDLVEEDEILCIIEED